MTGINRSLLAGAFALIFCSLVNAQDYSLSHFTKDDSTLASVERKHVQIDGLPSDFFGADETTAPAKDSAGNTLANIAVLAAFAGSLLLGGAITAACMISRRKSRRAAPMTFVGA